MQYIIHFFNALLQLSNAMAPYILFGLLFAGVLHEFIPDSIVSKHLGKSSIISVIKATIFGIPLPICSCGVIPLAANIKKSGASNGSTLAFLISTPITGVDSIFATYGIFGWIFTIYRVVTSMIISIIAGILTNFYSQEIKKPKPTFSIKTPNKNIKITNFSISVPLKSEVCKNDNCCDDTDQNQKKSKIKKIFNYAFITLLKDIASPLFIGLLLGALITTIIPANLSDILIKYSWLSYIVAIVIAIPMYVCATASLPIAAGLMLAGVSPGAAFVFLSAGPATNTVTIGVVKKMLGTRTLYIYLSTIIVGSILFGLGLDYMFSGVNVQKMVHLNEHSGVITWISTIILWSFVLFYMLKPYFINKKAH